VEEPNRCKNPYVDIRPAGKDGVIIRDSAGICIDQIAVDVRCKVKKRVGKSNLKLVLTDTQKVNEIPNPAIPINPTAPETTVKSKIPGIAFLTESY
jgi:hypothetical protein